jgi:hypothetical protein
VELCVVAFTPETEDDPELWGTEKELDRPPWIAAAALAAAAAIMRCGGRIMAGALFLCFLPLNPLLALMLRPRTACGSGLGEKVEDEEDEGAAGTACMEAEVLAGDPTEVRDPDCSSRADVDAAAPDETAMLEGLLLLEIWMLESELMHPDDDPDEPEERATVDADFTIPVFPAAEAFLPVEPVPAKEGDEYLAATGPMLSGSPLLRRAARFSWVYSLNECPLNECRLPLDV